MQQRFIALCAVMMMMGTAVAHAAEAAADAGASAPKAAEPAKVDAPDPDGATDEGGDEAAASPVSIEQLSGFCFFPGKPPADKRYTVIKKIQVGKQTYGEIRNILPEFANRAKALGADAVIHYTGRQRFGGPLPWRLVRPVARGLAVKWEDPKGHDCQAEGGTTFQSLMAEKPPAQ